MPVPGARVRTEPLPVELGGTGERSRESARENLGVPGLAGGNTFTGDQTFSGAVTVGQLQADLGVTTDGTVTIEEGTIDATLLTGVRSYQLPDNSGVLALTSDINTELPEWAYVAKTGTYGISASDCVVDCTSGSFTVTLPTAVGAAGKLYIIKNSGAGTITLATTSSQTIDGAAPGTLAAGDSVTLVSTGANWIIV